MAPNTHPRSPDWTLAETILAFDVYLKWGALDDLDPRTAELSETLRHLNPQWYQAGGEGFRNQNGVSMKLLNLRAHDPARVAKGTRSLAHGGDLDRLMWDAYPDPEVVGRLAQRIRQSTPRPGSYLTLEKPVDHSLFGWGTAIPLFSVAVIDATIGRHIGRGESVPIQLVIEGSYRDAVLTNLNRKGRDGDTYQLRYDSNAQLKSALETRFHDYHTAMERDRESRRLAGVKRPRTDTSLAPRIQLWTTEDPSVFLLELDPTQRLTEAPSALDAPSVMSEVDWERQQARSSQVATETDGAELESRARAARPVAVVSRVSTERYQRDPYVSRYAKLRANGLCQLCGERAPFCSTNGEPYLETHHIVWLSRGGRDDIENTVAVCPNCHRRLHVLDEEDDRRQLGRSTHNSAS